MSESFPERYFHLIEDVEDWLLRGHRVVHEPFTPAPRAAGTRPAAAPADTFPGREARLREIADAVLVCTNCRLHQGRTNGVPGVGVLDPEVLVIGEGPGAEEDRQGIPFVGPAGQYLDKWLAAIDIYRDRNAYIANIVKCRPPNNRDPEPDEAAACMPYLKEQVELLRPKAILTVGRVALRFLTGETAGIGRVHGSLYDFHGLPLMPTYHPSGVLRNPEYRRPVWEDLKKLRDEVLRARR